DHGRRPLDRRQRADEGPFDMQPRDREVLDRPLRLRRPLGIGGNPHLAHRIVLNAPCVAHYPAPIGPLGPRSLRSLIVGTVVPGGPVAPIGGPPLLSAATVHSNRRRLRPRPRLRWLSALALMLGAPILMAAPAAADPIAAKQAQVEKLARQ